MFVSRCSHHRGSIIYGCVVLVQPAVTLFEVYIAFIFVYGKRVAVGTIECDLVVLFCVDECKNFSQFCWSSTKSIKDNPVTL